MDELEPQAEATTEAAPTAPAPAPAAPPAPSGAEARIAELTAQRHEAERQWAARFEEQSRQVAELIRLAGEARSQPQAPAAPPPDIDPEEMRRYEYMANRLYGPKMAALEQQLAAQRQAQAAMAFQAVAAQERSPEVRTEAQKLWEYWQTSGNHKGFVIADAFTFARGVVFERQQAARAGEQRFGQTAPADVLTTHAAPPPLAPAAPKALPKNYDSLPWEEQERLYLEIYGNEPL